MKNAAWWEVELVACVQDCAIESSNLSVLTMDWSTTAYVIFNGTPVSRDSRFASDILGFVVGSVYRIFSYHKLLQRVSRRVMLNFGNTLALKPIFKIFSRLERRWNLKQNWYKNFHHTLNRYTTLWNAYIRKWHKLCRNYNKIYAAHSVLLTCSGTCLVHLKIIHLLYSSHYDIEFVNCCLQT